MKVIYDSHMRRIPMKEMVDLKKPRLWGLLWTLGLAALAGCGVDNAITSKVNETLNPPVASKTPVAVFAVSAESVELGSPVTVDGSYSYDPQGSTLTYAWTLVAPTGSVAALASATSAITSFTVDKGGYYQVSLQVTNASASASQIQSAQVSGVGSGGVNHPPVVILATTATAVITETAVLDGSLSYDADGDDITYSWYLVSAPSTSTAARLTNIHEKFPYLYTDVAGTYTVRLVVDDGTDFDEAYITVTAA
ncbi:MAG: PKD domain-containing protein [Nitrospinae bacterium]|nr:PKD domain-containing protein [Nitrospinota bacterium]